MKNLILVFGIISSPFLRSQEVVSTDAFHSKDIIEMESSEKESNLFIKSNAKVIKMGIQVNTPFHEMGPILSPDGKTLYFSRYNHTTHDGVSSDEEDIWVANRDQTTGEWNMPSKMDSPFNNTFPNYVDAVASDGKTLLLGNVYLPNGEMAEGLSISRKLNDEWSFPEKLNIKSIEKFTEWTGCFLSNDEKVLIMSCSKKNKLNPNSDLYVSFKIKDNEYSLPVNIGEVVNSNRNELSPFISKDGKTLFFSSNRKGGRGGYDIYMSTRLDDTYLNWSPIKNLGDKVNSEGNECFFSISNFDNSMFFVSESDNGDLDVFTVSNNNESTEISVKDKVVKLNTGMETVTGNKLTETKCFIDELNQMMVPINFEINSFELESNYNVTIQSISSLLEEYPNSNILITGHCDNTGEFIYNEKLSLERAKSVERSLLELGIKKERIYTCGMGETSPLFSNKTDEGRSKNRRVELIFFN